MNSDTELDDIRELSRRVGSNPLFVQGPTGNTSLKLRDTLWIKGSGAWLARACDDNIFVPVQLRRGPILEDSLAEYDAITRIPADCGLTPSIETCMHAIMPHRVVIHTHSTNTLAWAVRTDGPTQLARRLKGLRWDWIPYVRSGARLAREISQHLAASPDILILANHGLVIGAESCVEAEALLAEVENRLAISARGGWDTLTLLREQMRECESGWFGAQNPALNWLAADSLSISILSNGVLFPCQEIFLGTEAMLVRRGQRVCDCVWEYHQRHRRNPRYLVSSEHGILFSNEITPTELEILLGLFRLVLRLDEHDLIRYLNPLEIRELTGPGSKVYAYSAS